MAMPVREGSVVEEGDIEARVSSKEEKKVRLIYFLGEKFAYARSIPPVNIFANADARMIHRISFVDSSFNEKDPSASDVKRLLNSLNILWLSA